MRYTVKGFQAEGACEISGRQGEVVIIESDDGLTDASVSFKELQKMIRFRARQEEKLPGSTGNGAGNKQRQPSN